MSRGVAAPPPAGPAGGLLDPGHDPAPGSRRRWAIFGVGCLGFLLSMFYRVSTAVITPELTRDLELDPSQLGALGAAFYYAFAACQLPLGPALGRLGPRLTMTGLSVVGVAGAALFGLATDYHHALLGRVLMGAGMGGALMGVFALLAAWFPVNRFGLLSGTLVALGTAGNLLAATPLAMLAQSLGWRGSFLVIGGFHALVAALFLLVARDHPPGRPAPRRSKGSPSLLRAMLASPAFWGIAVVNFFRYGCFAAVQGTWAGPFLMEGLSLHKVTAGNVILMLGLGYMLGLPICGRLSDRVFRSRKWVALPGNVVLGILYLSVVLWGPDAPLWLALATFLGLGLWAAPGQLAMAHIKELAPAGGAAQAMTTLNLVTMVGPGVMSQVMGLALEHSQAAGPAGYDLIWYISAAGMLLGSCLYALVPDSPALRPAANPNKE